MKKNYLAPKNEETIKLSQNIENFSKFIDKFKEDLDCINIKNIDVDSIEKITIYSPLYYEEIYYEYINFIKKEKIKFYLFKGLTTNSFTFASYFYKSLLLYLQILKNIKNLFKKSETSKARKSLAPFCKGNGIDIGFGGDPITKEAISVDLFSPYAKYKSHPLNLKGSGDNLYWFKDAVLDFVYSSHLLEDFEHTQRVLDEWIRVLKPKGKLVLFLPNEQLYRAYCKKNGKPSNHNHIHKHFSLDFVKQLLLKKDNIKIIHEVKISNIYSFELVLEKL